MSASIQQEKVTKPESDMNNLGRGIKQGTRKVSFENVPLPKDFLVTRWHDDPFSCGSYPNLGREGNWDDVVALGEYEWEENGRSGNEKNRNWGRLHFCGDHCSISGWQCVNGAIESGRLVADKILATLDEVNCVRSEGELDEIEEDGKDRTDGNGEKVGREETEFQERDEKCEYCSISLDSTIEFGDG